MTNNPDWKTIYVILNVSDRDRIVCVSMNGGPAQPFVTPDTEELEHFENIAKALEINYKIVEYSASNVLKCIPGSTIHKTPPNLH